MTPDEVQIKFRNSQLALFGWRSREMSAAMKKKFDRPKPPPFDFKALNEHLAMQKPGFEDYTGKDKEVTTEYKDESGAVYARETDVSKMTGAQALKYMNSFGFKIPMVTR